MSVIGFTFTKITAERKSGPVPRLSINAKTGIKAVKEGKIGSQKTLTFTFGHFIAYNPSFATVTLEGEVTVLSNEKEVKDTLAQYEKTKNFSPELTQKVYNAVLTRANVEALLLAKELGLPPPFRLPHVAVGEKDAAKADSKPKKK